MKILKSPGLTLCLALALAMSCGTVREVPVKEIVKETVRDSIIIKRDTIEISVPQEIVKERIPEMDTSYLKTTLAESTAYVDTLNKVIVHDLKNIPQEMKKPVELKERIVTKTEYKEKEVPVKIPEPYIPKWCWILVAFNACYFGIKTYKIITHNHFMF